MRMDEPEAPLKDKVRPVRLLGVMVVCEIRVDGFFLFGKTFVRVFFCKGKLVSHAHVPM